MSSTFPLKVTVSRAPPPPGRARPRARVEQVAVSGIVPEAGKYEPIT